MNNSYATEPFCQTARESARVSPPPGLTPYWDINRAEASAIFPSLRSRTDFQRLSSYQIPSSAIQFLRISYSLKASAEERGTRPCVLTQPLIQSN
jgi:hypothetical protein